MLNRSLQLILAVLSSYVSVALAEKMDEIDPAKFDQSLLSEAYRFVQENYESQLDPSDYREIRIFWSNERRTYHLSCQAEGSVRKADPPLGVRVPRTRLPARSDTGHSPALTDRIAVPTCRAVR